MDGPFLCDAMDSNTPNYIPKGSGPPFPVLFLRRDWLPEPAEGCLSLFSTYYGDSNCLGCQAH